MSVKYLSVQKSKRAHCEITKQAVITRTALKEASIKIKDLSIQIDRVEFESRLMREINTAITSTFELPEILSLILQVLTTLVNTQGVSLLLVNETDNTLRIAESYGMSQKDIENFYIYYARLDDSVFEDISLSKKPKFFESDANLAIPLLLSVPLISRNKVIGFLSIHSMYKNRVLTNEKAALVYALASQASIAISNAQMFLAMREQAIMDPCTGLYNFRHFQQKLDEEIVNGLASQEPLSLMILDIDHFKQVNDTWGHLYGDKVLHELGNLLKRNVRSEDTVCRYGGEEFAVIFPHCNAQVAYRIAERIRIRIEDTTSHDKRNIFKAPIHVSIGVTEFDDEINKIEFIRQADCALYWAKNNGRNRTHLYNSELEDEYQKYTKK